MEFLLNFDEHLTRILADYGVWTYAILALIIFCETGVVILPFLPGDSLLFAVGLLAGAGKLDFWILFFTLVTAAFIGDNLNYTLGNYFGPKIFTKEDSKFLKKENLLKTKAFFEKYGGKAIILARFVPIVRTLMPFVAGMGTMTRSRFMAYSFAAAVIWVGGCVGAGTLLGNIPWVKANFSFFTLLILVITTLPIVIEIVKHRKAASKAAKSEVAQSENDETKLQID